MSTVAFKQPKSRPRENRKERNLVPVTNLANPVWEQQHNEHPTTFDQFTLYRDMGPSRTQVAVAREVNVSTDKISDKATRWRWVERALAWDKHLDRLKVAEIELQAKSMGARQAKIGMMLQDKAEAALAMVDLSEPTVRDVVMLAEAGVKIERQARGEKTEETQQVIIQLPSVPSWAQGSSVIIATPGNTPEAKEKLLNPGGGA